jgi:UDP-N-acetylmuramoyl-L-alanyl-D-glutamate--2,6-diaminopimelate ligase
MVMIMRDGPDVSAGIERLLLGLTDAAPPSQLRASDITLDSRSVTDGCLFLAEAGISSHGLEHAQQAAQAGAVAIAYEPVAGLLIPDVSVPLIPVPGLHAVAGVIADRFFGSPSRAMEVVGVTGTNGKTSVTQLTAHAFGSAGYRCGVMGTLGVGMPGRLDPTTHTTPDCVSVHRFLYSLRQKFTSHAAIEVSSHALDQGRVAGVHFSTAVFTNLTQDHLDYHQDMEAYTRAKARLFEMSGVRNAVINLDDAGSDRMLAALPSGVLTVGYSLVGRQADAPVDEQVWATEVHARTGGLRVSVDGDLGAASVQAPLIGDFNASNLLAVLAILSCSHVPIEIAVEALARCPTVPGRMEVFRIKRGPTLVVDYAHTPDALLKALTALRAHAKGRLVCVFGCGGDRDRGKRATMGEIAALHSDRVVLTNDNPRTEDPDSIIAEIRAGMPSDAAVEIETDRSTAIRAAAADCGPDDIVLIAGKGHETVQIIGAQRLPYCDRDIAEDLAHQPREVQA